MAPPASAGGAVALPSGRTEYRQPADYAAEIAAIAAAHPGRARRIVIGTSAEGRPIEGLEIATGVARTSDGRPVHLELGLTHGREWPSGEVVMEFARELATGSAPRLRALRAGTRTVLIPVLNPDGFALSTGADPGARKNARGVDLNRNFGAFWGGPGSSDDPLSPFYRGPEPFSEPESQALRQWSSAHQVAVVVSNHTFGRLILHQPGFSGTDEPGLPSGTRLPGTARFAALGARMADATGYRSAPAHALDDITGAAEDWNYFNQFAFAYTTEIGDEFHGPYAEAVAAEYGGLRRAMLLAGEAAADARNHALLRGSAPPGRVLRLHRVVSAPTSYVITATGTPAETQGPERYLREEFTSTLTVPRAGRFRWHVNPSVRPLAALAGRRETWTLTCGSERSRIALDLGDVRKLRLRCR